MPRAEAEKLVRDRIEDHLTTQRRLLEGDYVPAMAAAAEALARSLRRGGKIVLFGNGGSAADAQHIAAEFVGRFLSDRPPLAALALTTDTSALTAIGNDYAFDEVFARQVEALVDDKDAAVGISTSGGSPNVVLGLAAAAERGATTVALTGDDGGTLHETAQHVLRVPTSSTPRIQEGHILVGHILCELTESLLLS